MRFLQQTDAILLFDLSNFVARATAIAGRNFLSLFTQMLLKQRRQFPQHRFVFAVEGSGTLRRQQLLPQYKDGRIPSPEFNLARKEAIELLRHVNCRIIKAPDGEADDAIASYVEQHCQDATVTILSNDRDLWQLIRREVYVQAKVKTSTLQIDRHACKRLLGVTPAVVPLMKALLGDKSDNIPRGVPRVTVAKLLRVANEAAQVENVLSVTKTADWLTAGDKTKIERAYPTVKQQAKVTCCWNQLNLHLRDCVADTSLFQEFLEQRGYREMTEEDINQITGVKT